MSRTKKILLSVSLIVFVIAIGFVLYRVIASQDGQKKLSKQKVYSELQLVEGKLVNFFNQMNQIEFENYKISVNEVKEENQKSDNQSQNQDGQGSSSEGQSSGDNAEGNASGSSGGSSSGGSSGGESGGSSSSGSSGGESSSGGTTSKQDTKKYTLEAVGVLTKSEQVDWQPVKIEVENLYLSIPTIILDLYQITDNHEEVLAFSSEFDNLTQAVKQEEKQKTLNQLTKVYEYIPKLASYCSDDETDKVVLKTKESIFKAYSQLDQGDWHAIDQEVKAGTQEFSRLLTSVTVDEQNQFNINKGYIMLNELQKAVEKQDVEIFLIKYKNLLEDLNSL